MPSSLPPYILYLLALIVSFVISMYAVRKTMFIMLHRKIYDIPDDTRKIHGAGIPSLGGIGIFIGYIITAAFFMYMSIEGWQYIVVSSVLLFFTGIYDDLMNMNPSKKLVAQLLASGVTVYFANIEIVSLNGLFGIGAIPPGISLVFTTFCCTFFINAFNFIDGIDGLACVLAILYTGLLGIMFAGMNYTGIACVSFCLMGAAAGLLFFNIAPARIYMGDTGSMLLGFSIFILSALFIELFTDTINGKQIHGYVHSDQSVLMIALSILYLPMFDAIRVFILRASKGRSPLKADRTHLHYYLLDAGFSHSQSVLIILGTNILIILMAFLLQDMNPSLVVFCMTVLTSVVLLIIYRLRQRHLAKA
jgi:UDP-GlcNAc:undecaprenyl-phosphate/decaprenyl-phosphate GlcNAc-1-phosphate transferase